VIPFFFISIIAEEPNGTLAVVLSLIPFTSSLSMAMRLSVTDVPIGELLLSLGLLLLGVMGAIWLAGRLFRVHTLLAGNLPKFSDLPRLILRG
jgi:ABC-2 type transport system permease protein